eukprot:6806615-Pyramimonas_sp.AAC.1
MRELEFVNTALHGCAYGLKDSKGNFMKKPWTIATTSSVVAEGLGRRCDGTREHVEARERECKSAEYYTDAFAKQVHLAIACAVERSLSSRRRSISSSN